MMRNCVVLLALCGVLAGCGSVPPVPTDRYYRLQPASAALRAKALAGTIAVEPLRADSLYAERAIVFSEEANPRQLRQYHYHLWFYVPAQMVQDHMIASLGSAFVPADGSTGPWRLEGRVVRFDRVLEGTNGKAAAALELVVSSQGRTLMAKTYSAEQPATDPSFSAFAAAMERALAKIYTDFLRDLDAADLAARK